MQFEILLDDPTWERIALPFAKNLERLGITARVRTVDAAQYEKRQDDFDFDLIVARLAAVAVPRQRAAGLLGIRRPPTSRGSRNLAGIKDPVVDGLIDLVIAAPDRPSLIARTRALDRVLLWGHYVIPHWHIRTFRVVYWDKFGRPRRLARSTRSGSTPGGSTRRRRPRSPGARARFPSSRGARRCSPTSSAASC